MGVRDGNPTECDAFRGALVRQVERRLDAFIAQELANAAKSTASDRVVVLNAHAVLASSCAMNAPRRRSTALANVRTSAASIYVAPANAHAVLASSCAMNLPMRRFADLDTVSSNVADLTHEMV